MSETLGRHHLWAVWVEQEGYIISEHFCEHYLSFQMVCMQQQKHAMRMFKLIYSRKSVVQNTKNSWQTAQKKEVYPGF